MTKVECQFYIVGQRVTVTMRYYRVKFRIDVKKLTIIILTTFTLKHIVQEFYT